MKRPSIFVFAVLFVLGGLGLSDAEALIVFGNGGSHVIDYATGDDVSVYDSAGGHPTTVSLVDGGFVQGYGNMQVWDSSRFVMTGGEIGYYLGLFDNSTAKVSGGFIGTFLGQGEIWTGGNSQLEFSGGQVYDILTMDDSEVEISGGQIHYLIAYHNSAVTISGGLFGSHITSDSIYSTTSVITFVGNDFLMNGSPVAYGTYTRLDLASGRLTGVLASGDLLNCSFSINDQSSVIFVPEPATVLLLGLGAVMLRRKRSLA